MSTPVLIFVGLFLVVFFIAILTGGLDELFSAFKKPKQAKLCLSTDTDDYETLQRKYKSSQDYLSNLYQRNRELERRIHELEENIEIKNFLFTDGKTISFSITKDNVCTPHILTYKEFLDIFNVKEEFEEYKRKEEERIAKLNGPTFVYLIHDKNKGYYKIGITHDVPKREKTLLSETPNIEVILKKLFPTNVAARKTEKMFHKLFNEKQVRGEWFSLEKEDLDIVKTLLQ